MTGITKAYSDSPFDHVAMCLKFETDPGEVYFLESAANTGVALNKWSFLREHVGADAFYDKIVYRKVNFRRSDETMLKLEEFIK